MAWKTTPYKFNTSFFDKIDTQEKAYVLGMLYADGYNSEDRGNVTLSLTQSDREILEKINICLESDRPIRTQVVKNSMYNTQPYCELTFYNRHFSEKLAEIGCPQKKSHILKFPSFNIVPEYLIHHFIRGYVDGDGSIVLCDKNKNPNIKVSTATITSTEDFCLWIKGYCEEILEINSYITCRFPERENNTKTLQFGGNRQVKKFLDFIYKDATIYLERKFNKYLEISKYLYDYDNLPKTSCTKCGVTPIMGFGLCSKHYHEDVYYNRGGKEKRRERFLTTGK